MSNPAKTPVSPEDVFGPAVPDPDGTARGRPVHRAQKRAHEQQGELLQRLRSLGAAASTSAGPAGKRASGGPTSATGADPGSQRGPSVRDTMRSFPELGASDRTSRVERVDLDTPPPLPPAPLSDEPEGWFDSVATNPVPSPDLPSLALHGSSVTGIAPNGRLGEADSTRAIVKQRGIQIASSPRPAWVLPALLSTTSLAVGMVLGALIFGADSSAESQAAPAAVVGECAPTAVKAVAPASTAVAAAPAATRCSLDIASTPPGARVTVDGRGVGQSPITATDLPCDRPVEVVLRKGRFHTARRTATPGTGVTAIDVALRRR